MNSRSYHKEDWREYYAIIESACALENLGGGLLQILIDNGTAGKGIRGEMHDKKTF